MFKVTIYQQKQGPAFRVVLGDHASGEFETTVQVTVCEHSERDGAIDAAIAVTTREEIRAQLLRMRSVAPEQERRTYLRELKAECDEHLAAGCEPALYAMSRDDAQELVHLDELHDGQSGTRPFG